MQTDLILTISRQYGSGGRQIGIQLAGRLGLAFYDKEMITLAARNSGVAEHFFEQPEQDGIQHILWDRVPGLQYYSSLSDRVYLAQYAAIREISKKGSCVIVGHGAGEVLKDVVPTLNVFIYANMDDRIHRAVNEYGDAPEKIEAHIAEIDKKRASYFQFYAHVNGRQMENYHLCVDSGSIGIEGTAELIANVYELRKRQLKQKDKN